MISITIFQKNNVSYGFKIKGHALSREQMESETGDVYDLICNSISVLSQSAVIGITEVLKLPVKYDTENGFLQMNLFNLKAKDVESAQVLLLTFEKSLESVIMSLEASFGKKKCKEYIKLLKKEVQDIC